MLNVVRVSDKLVHWVVKYARLHENSNAKRCKIHFTRGRIML